MLSILTVPAFDDNYLWLIHDGSNAVAVDPGDANAIISALDQHQLRLSAILLTHHHNDHIGGVPALLQRDQVPVYGPDNDGIAAVTHPVRQHQEFTLPDLGLSLNVLAVPGHTSGHIAYFAPEQHWLFCGDTLFAGGCGRLFEGTPAQMLHSLDQLATLPEDTAVYCAHEYTMSNLRFAREVEPDNEALLRRISAEQAKRDQSIPTVPSQIGLEKLTNPFLRVREPAVIKRLIDAGKISTNQDDASNFGALREWKNNYR
ncbi:hydroxyacylglutathione hydrolase [Undibacterium sp. Jales W-56]|uniref:hydroxyacylglutathione hydrolase n=1 Tax=Undibacterium sp. Jales W-56 TaxID=2897325 RepID=UPI0021D22024|nr:hydroxyacylglutathione hydrolase [Undibacterium sp. Jales W-56]MCU6435847.1 hydroxyacylglutathione hydrolase [Undibacterium sp. Jales W-56]